MAFTEEMRVFCGNASSALARGICSHLGMEPGKVQVGSFSDGEVRVQIKENIRGKDVFIVNSTSPPVNEHLMELLILIDAAKRASAERVTAVLPYFGYARQDRKDRPRVPITAKLVSNLIVAAGAERVLTLDLHCDQIQGFFDVPLDHLSSEVVFVKHVLERARSGLVVISPDPGSVKRARAIAERLDAPLAVVDKRRPRVNEAEVMRVIGEVAGKHALIFDDIIDTAATLVKSAKAIKDLGAVDVMACTTHAVFSGRAIQDIKESVLDQVCVSDSIPLSKEAAECSKIAVISFASLLAEAIRRIHEEESVSILFK